MSARHIQTQELIQLAARARENAYAPYSKFKVGAALLGKSAKARDHLVEYANSLAIRKNSWKLIPAARDRQAPAGKAKGGRVGDAAELYDLARDIGETKNVAKDNPEIVREMVALLDRIRSAGRSRP